MRVLTGFSTVVLHCDIFIIFDNIFIIRYIGIRFYQIYVLVLKTYQSIGHPASNLQTPIVIDNGIYILFCIPID